MKTSFVLYSLLSSLFLLTACNQQPERYLSVSIPKNMKFIGHKGSGSINESGNIGLQENTWNAIANAMNLIDGSEFDLRLSADSTLWIFHDDSIINCSNSKVNFSKNSDFELTQISDCNYNSSIIRFSDFLSKAQQEPWKEKIICLDVKTFYNLETIHLFEDNQAFTYFIRDKLNDLIKTSKIEANIIFEVFNTTQFHIFDSVFKDKTYLVVPFPSQESILAKNEAGINLSLPIYNLPNNLDPTKVKIQDLWTINTANQFFEALKFSPQIMQTDNIPMMHFFKSIQKGKKAICISSTEAAIKTKDDEFHSLLTLNLPLEKDQLIQFTSYKDVYPDDVLLEFKVVDEEGNSVHWEGEILNETPNSSFYVNSDFLIYKNAKTVQINIWNKSKSPLDHKFKLSQFSLK